MTITEFGRIAAGGASRVGARETDACRWSYRPGRHASVGDPLEPTLADLFKGAGETRRTCSYSASETSISPAAALDCSLAEDDAITSEITVDGEHIGKVQSEAHVVRRGIGDGRK